MFAEFPLVTFCSDAGNWLFCGRKWIDPADPDGRTLLELHHHNLSILFPAFAAACSRDRFIDAVAGVIESWSRQTAAAAAAGRRPSVVDIPPSSHTATDSDASPEAHTADRLSVVDVGVISKSVVTATDSDSASPPDAHAADRPGGCALLAAGPDDDSDDGGGRAGPDAWMGSLGVGADDGLRPLAFAACAT